MGFVEIFRDLDGSEVDYIIAGGYAAVLYGVPRMTFDLDLLLRLQHDNLERFVGVVDRYGYKPKVPVSIYDLIDEEKIKQLIQEKNVKALNLVSPTESPIDILFDIPVNYETALSNCEYRSLGSIKLPLLSIDDLILCKRVAGRNQDLSDIKALELIKHKRWKDE